MSDDKERINNNESIETPTVREAEQTPAQPAMESHAGEGLGVARAESSAAAMELPEIPSPAAVPVPVSLYDPPKVEPKKGSAGWKLFAAALALVGLSASVGSGTTYYFLSRNQQNAQPIGYELMQSAGMKAAAQGTSEAAASVVPTIYRRVAPSVVAINVVSGQGFYRAEGSGSGFVVDTRGYILTNYHVIDSAERIQVKFVDGTTLAAKVVGTYKWRDLAVLKVEPGDRQLVAAPLGDSDKVEVGELAVAIGNPFGQEFTVTAGIVSALNREIAEQGNPVSIPGAIQTDAAINPGNSGGPLINGRGEVIGINTAIEGPVKGNVGLGFAVPINLAREVLPAIISGQKLQKPFLGVELRDMNAQAAKLLGTETKEGALVWGIEPDSGAERSGLRPPTFDEAGYMKTADVIIMANGTKIRTNSELINFISRQKIGDTITLTVVRGKEQVTLKATLGGTDVKE